MILEQEERQDWIIDFVGFLMKALHEYLAEMI